jgi:subtilase family protein/fibronectin type III domain protein/PA domain-containing protein
MRGRLVPVAVALAVVMSVVFSIGASAAPNTREFRLAPDAVSLVDIVDVPKSVSGRLAETDPSLLRRTSSELVSVMLKLDYDAIASYAGGIEGLPPTSPTVTGRSLDDNPGAVASYRSYVSGLEKRVLRAVNGKIPRSTAGRSFRLAYGGVSLQLPANEVGALLAIPGVAAVQKDSLNQPLQVEEPYQSIGAEAVWNELGGPVSTGEGVVVANLDTGIWPEHPMFDDLGLAAPPAPANGTRACEFGLSGDANDPAFACDDKLIGAQAFLDTYTTFIGAEPGEYCDTVGPAPNVVCSARDADGHGTHTLTTAAGNFVNVAEMWGAGWGPTSGMAPGAHVIGYRVCLDQGCFTSDSVAAVNEAIADGADVINFSISGGNNAYTDAVELAFLDFYASGGLANASAGNSGPGAATADHAGPWTNTVAASYPSRIYQASLHLESGGETLDATGVTITPGIDTPTDVIRASAAPGYTGNATCNVPLPAGSATGKIVLCERGNPAGRAASGFNVLQGGAEGMILTNVAHQDLFTDLHWLPTIMLDDGTWQGADQPGNEVRAFVDAHPGATTATFTSGTRAAQTPDILTSFSSRGPLGDWIKPDVTAPGIEILAGRSPQPWSGALPSGPPGDLYMAIAGTSMSSPHAAGVSALVKAAHPSWTPGQIKSALMTSSVQTVLRENGVTPANPFDTGAGSIRANRAIHPTLTFDASAAQYAALAVDPLHRIDANLPSVNAPTMSGSVTTSRTGMNVSGARQRITVHTASPSGGTITVKPSSFTLPAGGSKTLTITINGVALVPNQQYFGSITLDAAAAGANDVFMPVAFFKRQGAVTLSHTCSPTSVSRGSSASCEVRAQNLASVEAATHVDVNTQDPSSVGIRNAAETHNPTSTGVLTPRPDRGFDWDGTLSAAIAPTVDSITAGGSPKGEYLPLSSLGVPPIGGMGDESIANFDVPEFLWGEEAYTQVGVTSNGYVVIGGGASADVVFEPQTMPDPAQPNNVIAPWWTDLDLSQAATPNTGARIEVLEDTTTGDAWLVIDYEDVATFGSCTPGPCDIHDFQIWIGLVDDPSVVEDVTMAHGDVGTGVPGFTNAGAENRDGSSGVNMSPLPSDNTDWTINTSPPTPGGFVEITYDAVGKKRGTFVIPARMTTDQTVGITTERVTLTVT